MDNRPPWPTWVRLFIPRVEYRPHANERSLGVGYQPMRKIGFAPWDGYPRINDRNQDDETFHQQKHRLRHVLKLPDEEDEIPM